MQNQDTMNKNTKTALYVPFDKLIISPKNARSIKPTKDSDKDLIHSIKTLGLLQSLVVTKNKRGLYEIIGGGRRYGAIKHLIKEKHFPKNHEVLVSVIDDSIARLGSYAENNLRQNVHPYDNWISIKSLKEQGQSIDSIAFSLNIPKTQVVKLLKLSAVNEKILEHFKKDEISLDALQIFTMDEDTNNQLKIFKKVGKNPQAWLVERQYTDKTMPKEHRLVKFVGFNTYEKLGGKVISNLFNDEVHLTNPEIVHQLAEDKIKKLSKNVQSEGWGWVEVTTDSKSFYEFDSTPTVKTKIPKLLLNKIKDTSDLIEEHTTSLSNDSNNKLNDEKKKKLETTIKKLKSDLSKLEKEKASYFEYVADAKPFSGVIVCVNNGKLCIERGLMKRKDYSKYEKYLNDKNNNKVSSNVSAEISSELSQVHKDILRAEDKQLYQLALMKNPKNAFDVACFELCYSVLSDVAVHHWSHTINASMSDQIDPSPELINTVAYKEIEKIVSTINCEWIKDTVNESYIEFCKLSQDQKIILFGLCAGHSGIADAQYIDSDKSVYRVFLKQVKFNKSEFWKPTLDYHFKKLNLANLKSLGTNILGKKWVKSKESENKTGFAKALDTAFKDNSKLDTKTQDRINSYLPEIMK